MKRIIISIIPLILLSGCESEEQTETTFDIECLNKADGWHKTEQTILDQQGNSYLFDGSWHCKSQKLWYSSIDSELNLFGRFYVTQTDTAELQTKFQYDFIQMNKAQNLVIQSDGSNENNNREVESFDMTLTFLTDAGVLPQLLTMNPYSSDSYALEYNVNSANIALLSKTIFKAEIDGLYQLGTSECSASNNQDWDCAHWDSYFHHDQTEDEKIAGENSTKSKSLTPDTVLLNNPLEIRNELIRLSDNLFN